MLAPIFLIKAVIDGMIGRKFGRIVNITSASVKSPIPQLGMSNGARAGLTGFVAGLARQVAQHNVVINNILPGPFLTDRLRSGCRAARAAQQPSGRGELALRGEEQSHRPRRRSGGIRRRLRVPVLRVVRLHRRPQPASRRRRLQFVHRIETDPPRGEVGEGDRAAAHPRPVPAMGRGERAWTHLPVAPCRRPSRESAAWNCRTTSSRASNGSIRRINAVVVRDFDRARARARALDNAARRAPARCSACR